MKLTLPFLETMLTQVCNLSCVGCTNYSDMTHTGYVTWQQGRAELEPWLERITIPDFGLIGGEPLINPEYREWIYGCRELMPDSQLRFTTNGELLHKATDIFDVLYDVGNIVFKITVHKDSPELEEHIKDIFSKYFWETVTEWGITRYKSRNNVRFQINRPKTFVKSFRGNYENMMPYNSNPRDSFDICCQQTCPLLYQGKIYKCSTSGLLKEVLTKTGNINRADWQDYIVDGIGPSDDVESFIRGFGRPEAICRMCPTSADPDAQIEHKINVTRK